jgi:hypothetical protein
LHKAIDTRDSEWGVLNILELLKDVMIERELWRVVETIRKAIDEVGKAGHRLQKLLNCFLSVFGQVKLVTKVKRLVSLDMLDHLNKGLVLGVLLKRGHRGWKGDEE